jgi:hypothetical protein
MGYQTQDLRYITSLFAATIDERRRTVYNNVNKNVPLLAYMGSALSRGKDPDGMGKGVRLYRGGGKIRFTVRLGTNPNGKWMAPYENYNTNTTDEDTDAFEEMKKYGSSAQISLEERDDNQGRFAIRDLIQRKVDGMEQDFKEAVEQSLMAGRVTGAGTALYRSVPNVNGPNPLGYLIQKNPSANADAVHEIDQQAEPLWQNQALNMTSDIAVSSGTYADFRRAMARMYNQTMAFSDTSNPDFGICDQYFHEFFESTLVPVQRLGPFGSTSVSESLGIRGLAYKDMIIFWSQDMLNYGTTTTDPVSTTQDETEAGCYFLNSGALELRVSAMINMRVGVFREPVDQDAVYGKMAHRTQLITTQRRKLGIVYALDTTSVSP